MAKEKKEKKKMTKAQILELVYLIFMVSCIDVAFEEGGMSTGLLVGVVFAVLGFIMDKFLKKDKKAEPAAEEKKDGEAV